MNNGTSNHFINLFIPGGFRKYIGKEQKLATSGIAKQNKSYLISVKTAYVMA